MIWHNTHLHTYTVHTSTWRGKITFVFCVYIQNFAKFVVKIEFIENDSKWNLKCFSEANETNSICTFDAMRKQYWKLYLNFKVKFAYRYTLFVCLSFHQKIMMYHKAFTQQRFKPQKAYHIWNFENSKTALYELQFPRFSLCVQSAQHTSHRLNRM